MLVLRTGVPGRLGVARSASSPKAAQALGCSLTPGLRISFWVTCMAQAASVHGLWTLGFLLLCGACVSVWVVFGLGFRLRPATPGWGDGVCVCLRARSARTPPFLARLGGVVVCAWAPVSAAPRYSWLGCWVLWVLVCPLRSYLPLLAGVIGVHVCARARFLAPPRHSWLRCWGVRVSARLRLYPATPGWGLRCGRVCLGLSFGCALPVLVELCGVVGVLGFRFGLRPAIPGWCWRACFACTLPFLGGVCDACALVRVLAFKLPILAWVIGCVCLFACSSCTPPILAGLCGVGVCASVQVWAFTSSILA